MRLLVTYLALDIALTPWLCRPLCSSRCLAFGLWNVIGLRAGVYIAENSGPSIRGGRRTGLRGVGEMDPCPDGFPAQFTDRQDKLQQIVVVVVPFVLTVLSDGVALAYSWSDCYARWGLIIWIIVGIAAWCWLQRRVRRIARPTLDTIAQRMW